MKNLVGDFKNREGLSVTFTLSIWTFGPWWGVFGRTKVVGFDLGPVEIVHRRAR